MPAPRYLYWRNRRAAPPAYWIDNRIAVAEVEALPEGVRSVPDRATAPRRAANSAYWIPNRIEGNVPPDPVEELPEGQRTQLPDRSPGPRRTARPAYQVDTSWMQNVLTGTVFPPPATYRMSISQPFRLYRRAPNSAYWMSNVIAGNVPPDPLPEGTLSISDIFRIRRRTANVAYWIPNRIAGNVPPDPGEDLPPGMALFPSRTRGALRGSNVIYWLVNLLEGNVPPTPPPVPPVVGANLPPYGQVIFNSADEDNRPRFAQRIARGTEE